MMIQSVLPFKLEITEEKLTAHAGLAVFGNLSMPRKYYGKWIICCRAETDRLRVCV